MAAILTQQLTTRPGKITKPFPPNLDFQAPLLRARDALSLPVLQFPAVQAGIVFQDEASSCLSSLFFSFNSNRHSITQHRILSMIPSR